MRATFLAGTLVLATSLAWSGGQSGDSGAAGTSSGTTSAATTMQIEGSGQVVTYATPADYKQATGNDIPAYTEAPVLAALVASGALPPVAERLPEEPLVVVPANEIGRYGGEFRTARDSTGLDSVEDLTREFPVAYTVDLSGVVPNLFKSWDITDGGRTFTFHLRRGMKWNDASAFTVDPFMFYFTHIANNEEIFPSGVAELRVGGEFGVWSKVDDYTLRMTYAAPYGVLDEKLARWRRLPYAPGHYLEQFHPAFASTADLDAKVRADGFDTWVNLFMNKWHWYNNPEAPSVFAWTPINKQTDQLHRFERNPYYWKVDAAGQQLPYIDSFVSEYNLGLEALLLKYVAGDLDVQYNQDLGASANFAFLKQNEAQRGIIRIVPTQGWPTITGGISFNYTSDDPEKAALFANKDFKIALSLGIDREEVNDLIWNGAFNIRQVTLPKSLYNRGEADNPKYLQYTEYDPDRANQILDGLGLAWNANRTARTFPSGKPLRFNVIARSPTLQQVQMTEIYKQHWEQIGVEINITPVSGGLMNERVAAGNYDMNVRNNTFGGRPIIGPLRCSPVPICNNWWLAPEWGRWANSGGAEGVEPPEPYRTYTQQLFDLAGAYIAETDAEKRTQIEYQIADIHAEAMFFVGVLERPHDLPAVWYNGHSARMGNVSVPSSPEYYYSVTSSWYITE